MLGRKDSFDVNSLWGAAFLERTRAIQARLDGNPVLTLA